MIVKLCVSVLLGLAVLCLGSEVYPDHHGGGSDPCRRRSHGWSSWSNWGNCDVPCGYGRMPRTRECCGERCKGPDRMTRSCRNGPCIPIVIDKDRAVCSGMSLQFTTDYIINAPWWDYQHITWQAELTLLTAVNIYCRTNPSECFVDGKTNEELNFLSTDDVWTSQFQNQSFSSGPPDFGTLYNMRHTILVGIANQPNVMTCIPSAVFEKVFDEDLADKMSNHFISTTPGDMRMTAWEIVPHNDLGVQPEPTPVNPTDTWIWRLRVSRLMITTLACLAIFSGLAVICATCLICMKKSKKPEAENPKKDVKINLPVAPYFGQGVTNKGLDV